MPLTAILLTALMAQAPGATPAARDIREILRNGDLAALTVSLDQDPAAATRADATGVPPIHWAAFYGKREAAELLIARGADPRATSRLGTPLHASAFGGQVEMVRWLASKGVDPNAAAADVPAPLIVAVRRGTMPLVEALLAVGASPGVTDSTGNSALLLAASAGLEPAVRLLLAKGVDVNQANARGATPLDVARREGNAAIIALLEGRGAKGRPPLPPPSGSYFGQKPPGLFPELFAPDWVSTEKRELNAVFAPDGREFFFARERGSRGTSLMVSRLDGNRWTPPVPAPFSTSDTSDVDMFLTSDGQQLYFCSNRKDPMTPAAGAAAPAGNADIWVVARTPGGWGEPRSLGTGVNSDRDDYYPTLARDGTLYFSSNREGSLGQNDIYRSSREGGAWTTPLNLGAPINTEGREYDPFIAPDQSYLVFASERPGGQGGADLYLSVRGPDGSWAEPRNLGPPINTPESEYTPMLSPDGKYFFFTRGRLGYDDIYWVDAAALGPATATSRVDAVFGALDKSDSPGCALGVYRDGPIVHGRGYGMAERR